MLFRSDREGKFVVISDFFEESLGYNYGDFLDVSLYEIVEESYVEKLKRRLNNGFVSRRNISDFEICIIDKEKKGRYFTLNGIYLKDLDYMIGTFKDITESKKVIEDIEKKSYIDNITGVYNKNYYKDVLPKLDKESNLPLTIISGDVNGLKLANDTFGHNEGDNLLKAVADILKKSCRDSDLVFRWGGDEFLIILLRTPEDDAKKVINRIHENCNKDMGDIIKPSISLGFATKYDSNVLISNIERDADNMMYKNKKEASKEVKKGIVNWMCDKIIIDGVVSVSYIDMFQYYIGIFGKYMGISDKDIDILQTLAKVEKIGMLVDEKKYLDHTLKILKTSQIYYEIIPLLEELSLRDLSKYSLLVKIYTVIRFYIDEYVDDKNIVIEKINKVKGVDLDVAISDRFIRYLGDI